MMIHDSEVVRKKTLLVPEEKPYFSYLFLAPMVECELAMFIGIHTSRGMLAHSWVVQRSMLLLHKGYTFLQLFWTPLFYMMLNYTYVL